MEKAALRIFFGVLVLQHIVAAPNDVKLEDIAEVTQAEETTDKTTTTLLDETPEDPNRPQSQRQKRWYNYYGGFPPFDPNFFNRADTFSNGVLGQQDPLVLIHRRLQDISNSFRQQPPPPPQFPPGFPNLPNFPYFVPFFYVPQVGCDCSPNSPARPPIDNRPVNPSDNNNNPNITDPNVENRWPEMEDERQNWGIVTEEPKNNQDDNEEDEGDGSRPISFEPIRPSRPISRPAPPVEHGSVEGNVNAGNAGTTTTIRPTTFRPAQAPVSPGVQPVDPGLQPPSNCDSAILRCCHLPEVTYDCFAYQGCPDPSSYGYPCASTVISRVIDKFLKFYGQRNG